ncbi:MAG: sensor histidine kinase [Chloroflexota bacterium]
MGFRRLLGAIRYLTEAWHRCTLACRFAIIGFVIVAGTTVELGWWIAREVERGVASRSAATAALFIDAFMTPRLQGLSAGQPIDPESAANLTRLLGQTSLGQFVVAIKIWDSAGRVVYAIRPVASADTVASGESRAAFPRSANEEPLATASNVTQQLPTGGQVVLPTDPSDGRAMHDEVSRAFGGELVVTLIGDAEEADEDVGGGSLLEIYSPVRAEPSADIIGVAEFYLRADALADEIQKAKVRSWLVVGGAGATTYLLLVGIVGKASARIERQQVELNERYERTAELLSQNRALSDRVKRSARRTTELNEQLLRRVSAELHDGPAQDVAAALMRLDGLGSGGKPRHRPQLGESEVESLRQPLVSALEDLRGIAAGLRIPELEPLSLADVGRRAVARHARRTGDRVGLTIDSVPEVAPLPVKIVAYRVLQEALNNAHRHAGGSEPQAMMRTVNDTLEVVVRDSGGGFDPDEFARSPDRLGLAGMQERVASVGGSMTVVSCPGGGTTVSALIPLAPVGADAG